MAMPSIDETIGRADSDLGALAKVIARRYDREYDRYAKLTATVEHVCRTEVIEANAIRASVTSRTKHSGRVEGKALRKLKSGAWSVDIAPDAALDALTDLAGVRISTYVEADRRRVVDQIVSTFHGSGGGPVQVDEKSTFDVHSARFYRATHCDVVLTDEYVSGANGNVRNVCCEIQVTSMLAHVWNEIEHDLIYKPLTGDVSEEEREALRALGHLTVAADLLVQELYRATARRLEVQRGAFDDVYDFVARVRTRFPHARRFGDHAGQLLETLIALGFTTPDTIEDLIGQDPEPRSWQAIDTYEQLVADDERAPHMDRETSDVLLALLLETHATEIVDRFPSGRGLGRPPRIASIARRFVDPS